MTLALRAIHPVPVDPDHQPLVAMLIDWLNEARYGELRSIGLVGIGEDGQMHTQFSLAGDDRAAMVALLQHDLLADR